MNKKATLEEGINAVHQFRKAGIEMAAFFIVGYPGESLSSIEETFRLALTLPFDEISFNVPFPLPGSRLFDRVSGIDENKDWDKENEVTFVYSTEFDEAGCDGVSAQTMEAFAEKNGRSISPFRPGEGALQRGSRFSASALEGRRLASRRGARTAAPASPTAVSS